MQSSIKRWAGNDVRVETMSLIEKNETIDLYVHIFTIDKIKNTLHTVSYKHVPIFTTQYHGKAWYLKRYSHISDKSLRYIQSIVVLKIRYLTNL